MKVRVCTEIEADERDEFHVACLRNGTTITAALAAYIREALRRGAQDGESLPDPRFSSPPAHIRRDLQASADRLGLSVEHVVAYAIEVFLYPDKHA